MSEKRQRDFKGIWIPKKLYLDENLNWTEKLLLVEIDSLDNEEGCYASNKYFANFLSKSKVYISNCISKLKKEGYIYQESFDGRKRVLRSKMRVKLKNNAELNSSLRQDKEKVKGGDSDRDTNETGLNNEKKSSNKLINNKDYKTEEEDAHKIPEKISTKFEQVFNRKMSVELYNKLIKFYSDPQILMKALQVAEEQADKPKYLLIILKDWKKENMTSVSEINSYLEKRDKNNSKKSRRLSPSNKKEHDKLHNVKNLEEKGWNSQL